MANQVKIKPLTEWDIMQDEKQERFWAMSYHKGVVDFVKWTSTLAGAAMLWVSNAISTTTGWPRFFMIASSISLILSLVLAIFTARQVLAAWATEWKVASEMYTLSVLKKFKATSLKKVSEEKEREQINRLLSAYKDAWLYQEPAVFNRWVTGHTLLLAFGLAMYLIAQALSAI